MFSVLNMYAGVKATRGSQNLIAILIETTSAKYPIKKYIPFCSIISASAIREPVFRRYIGMLCLICLWNINEIQEIDNLVC